MEIDVPEHTPGVACVLGHLGAHLYSTQGANSQECLAGALTLGVHRRGVKSVVHPVASYKGDVNQLMFDFEAADPGEASLAGQRPKEDGEDGRSLCICTARRGIGALLVLRFLLPLHAEAVVGKLALSSCLKYPTSKSTRSFTLRMVSSRCTARVTFFTTSPHASGFSNGFTVATSRSKQRSSSMQNRFRGLRKAAGLVAGVVSLEAAILE